MLLRWWWCVSGLVPDRQERAGVVSAAVYGRRGTQAQAVQVSRDGRLPGVETSHLCKSSHAVVSLHHRKQFVVVEVWNTAEGFCVTPANLLIPKL